MKKLLAVILSALIILAMFTITVFAINQNVKLDKVDSRLEITEAGSYVLTGTLKGSVYVDPGSGEVELILDGADISGGENAGIIAVSGDKLIITLPEGSVNRIAGNGGNLYEATIYSTIDTVFEGSGALYVIGSASNGIKTVNSDLTFEGGNYAVSAKDNAILTEGNLPGTLTVNDGHFSTQAENNIAPNTNFDMNGGFFDQPFPENFNMDQNGENIQKTGSIAQNIQQPPMEGNMNQNNQQPPMERNVNQNNQQPPMEGNMNQKNQQPPMERNVNQNNQQPPMEGNMNQNNQQPPMEGNVNQNNQQPPMEGNMNQNNQQSQKENDPFQNGQIPNNQQNGNSADSPSDIVYGTMTNSASTLEADYDNASYISVTDDNSQIKITSSGTYVISGSSTDGNITVKKGTSGVILILENLDLTSTTGATVSVNKEAEVKIIISGNVVLTDNENPDDEYSSDTDTADAYDGAALKAKANSNVFVTGDGTLTINGNAKNGIKAGDDSSLIFDGVAVNINAVNDGINSNYDVTLLSGNFTIAAGDDAIHADHILTIGSEDNTGPTINVTESTEGLEGTIVNILGGDISIISSDDAVNAANEDGIYEGELDYSFNMLDGKIVINSKGDGIDSNGDVNLIGGSADIKSSSGGGEAGIDYDGQYYISNEFNLNNKSGISGADMNPGDINNQQPQMNNQQPQTNSQQSQMNNHQGPDQNRFANGNFSNNTQQQNMNNFDRR